jgi:protein-S-isoprenylcysteine O-methyltransferase Ste14
MLYRFQKASNRSSEYPAAIYWALQLSLWAILIGTVVAVSIHIDRLELWKIGLYAILLGAYLWVEKKAHRPPQATGQRAYETLRYLLSLIWWLLILGSLLVYALWPVSQVAVTIFGALLMAVGSALRVWGVHTLGACYSGHIETWEGQSVIQSGPYRIIRHPGYAGSILQTVGMPLILNAYAALILSAAVIILFVHRLLWEEAWLANNLAGYRDYASDTWRLLPGIW